MWIDPWEFYKEVALRCLPVVAAIAAFVWILVVPVCQG
jgi:hypothetical protein